MKSSKLFLMSLMFAGPLSLAHAAVEENPHAVFVGVGMGSNEIDGNKEDSDDWDLDVITQLGYRYQFDKNWALDARYLKGTSSGFKQIASLTLLDGEIEFDNVILSGQGKYALTQHGFLYANLGATRYDWEATGDTDIEKNQTLSDDSGAGLFAAAGVKGEWQSWELGLEYQQIHMGDLTSKNWMFSFGYKF